MNEIRVVEIGIKNLKRVTAVTIRPKRHVSKIGGKNGNGKSSTLDGLMYALGGSSTIKDGAVHGTKSTMEIEVDLGAYTVSKKVKAGGNEYLVVKNSDGKKQAKPQAFLDELCGKIGLAFDPIAFGTKDSKVQLEIVKEIVGLDFTKLDKLRSDHYDDRRIIKRELKALNVKYKALIFHDDIPEDMDDSSEIFEKYEAGQEKHKLHEDRKADIAQKESRIKGIEYEMEGLREQMRKAKEKGLELKAKKEDILAAIEIGTEDLEKMILPDLSLLKEQMKNISEFEAKIKDNKARTEMKSLIDKRTEEETDLDDKITKIDENKISQLESAEFPIEGLSFGDNCVTYKGHPLEHASSSERIHVGMAIAFSMDNKLKIALIRDGSLLDEDSMDLVEKLAEKHDAMVWIERVTNDPTQVDFFIEDGVLKNDD